jgi:hypothetical protein
MLIKAIHSFKAFLTLLSRNINAFNISFTLDSCSNESSNVPEILNTLLFELRAIFQIFE